MLLAAYGSLGEGVGFRAELGRAFHYVGWREGLFWVAHHGLALPGMLLLAHGVAPWLGPRLRRGLEGLEGLADGKWRLMGLGMVALLLAWATWGRANLLLGLPITDDENGVLFGARMLLEGDLSVPLPEPAEAFPLLFTYLREGRISSMDYPGGIFFLAASLASGLGPLAYGLLAALSGLAMAWAGGLLWGRRGAVAAAGIWILSPMVQTLSLTQHPHLLSRSFVALAYAAYLRLVSGEEEPERPWLWGLAFGMASGLAGLCRPIESLCLLLPVGLHLLLLGLRPGPYRRAFVMTLAGALPAALLFAWHNASVTGLWFLQARFAPGASSHTATQGAWELLGLNFGFNITMLGVFFLGPFGILLVALGLGAGTPLAGRVKGVLGASLLLHLLLALLHADTGLHLVGPIHYSESAVPLTLLAVLGLARLEGLWRQARLEAGRGLALLAGFGASLLLFTAVHAQSLRAQAEVLEVPRRAMASVVEAPALVVADPQHELWEMRPEMARVRSWAVEYQHPDPYLRQDVLLVYPKVKPEVLDREFPERRVYRMTYAADGEPVRIRLLREPLE